jgi:hypothetical protein
LELVFVVGWWLTGQPTFGGQVGSFEFPAGLGMRGLRTDMTDPQGAHGAFEVDLGAGEEPSRETRAVVGQHVRGESPLINAAGERIPDRSSGGLATHACCDQHAGVIVEDIHDPYLAAVGEHPGGGIDLPTRVRCRPLKTAP